MRIIVIIQARMGSTRLPGKVLKPLGENDVLAYVVERCRKIKGIADVIVATSVLEQDNQIEEWCAQRGVSCFRGSEDDVLDRYVQCAKPYNPDYVMRVTSDCPFVDFGMANEIVSLIEKKQVDIVDLDGELPRGLAVELISYPALLYIHQHGQEQRHREHVTYYAYEYRNEFSRVKYMVPENRQFPVLRITLDTQEDYDLCRMIAANFNNPIVPSDEVVSFLNNHPDIAKINQHIEQKPVV
ncbi:cytidylyltransferase domain-containing protein [Lederbergia citri]|uniref:Glycosyltransferase family protein n=1 Tax=Lederbergia citri TaxID=2833580 RepID=A0A942TD19_9BACI|nr:glycosyltransferase family protein [Lederbergia citri]MBS4195488.1 glycosyltransferase family protein [Lederbergia citri]